MFVVGVRMMTAAYCWHKQQDLLEYTSNARACLRPQRMHMCANAG